MPISARCSKAVAAEMKTRRGAASSQLWVRGDMIISALVILRLYLICISLTMMCVLYWSKDFGIKNQYPSTLFEAISWEAAQEVLWEVWHRCGHQAEGTEGEERQETEEREEEQSCWHRGTQTEETKEMNLVSFLGKGRRVAHKSSRQSLV